MNTRVWIGLRWLAFMSVNILFLSAIILEITFYIQKVIFSLEVFLWPTEVQGKAVLRYSRSFGKLSPEKNELFLGTASFRPGAVEAERLWMKSCLAFLKSYLQPPLGLFIRLEFVIISTQIYATTGIHNSSFHACICNEKVFLFLQYFTNMANCTSRKWQSISLEYFCSVICGGVVGGQGGRWGSGGGVGGWYYDGGVCEGKKDEVKEEQPAKGKVRNKKK